MVSCFKIKLSQSLMHELDASGNITTSYVADANGRLVSVTRALNTENPSTFFYHYNAHGDVVAITNADGSIVARFSYDPWGMPIELDPSGTAVTIGSWTASTGGTPGDGLFILFGGMLYDAAAGLYLTKTRAYNPKTGRFLQRDILDEDAKEGYDGFPFGKDAIGTNLYAWCNNNPVNRVDPSGLDSFGEWGRRVGGFVGGLFGRSDLGAAIGGYVGDRIDYAVGYAGISLGSNSGYNFSGYTAGNRARAKQAKPAPEKVLKSVSGKSGTPGNFTARGNTYSAQTSFTSQNVGSFLGGGLSSGGSHGYVPPDSVGRTWRPASVGFNNSSACAGLGAGVTQIGGKALAAVPDLQLEGAYVYYMGLEASLVMDAQAHDDGQMGDKEYYLRTGANIGGLIPGPVMQTASYGPTVYDAYGCLASAYYVGNYD